MNKLDLKPVLKRIGAYMIDIIVTVMVATLITNIPIINTKYQKYQDKYQEYQKLYTEYTNTKNLLKESYNDSVITKEEYEKLIKDNSYQEIITKYYEDEKITADEYDSISSDIDKEYTETAQDYNYELQKLGIYNSIVTLSTTLVYFGVIAYLFKGQTLGKKLLNIQIVSANDKKLTIFNYLLRSLIVNNVLLNGINLIFLGFTSKETFLKCDNIISLLISLIEATIIYLVIVREDHRGLHDLICNTKVIDTKKASE